MITTDRRPTEFESVYPTCDVAAFEKDLKENQFPNVSMFYGPPGLGKTTIARILAAKILKLTDKDAKAVITMGMLAGVPGFYEYDFALKGKAADIEEVAERLYRAKLDSLHGEASVFILDEFTEASGGNKDKTESTQKKLSKTLEDAVQGPFYVIFITNDRHKVEESIESRAEEYEFKELSFDFCMKFFDENAKAIANVEVPKAVKEKLYHAVPIKAPRKLLISLNQYLHRGIIAGETSEDIETIASWVTAVNALSKQMAKDDKSEGGRKVVDGLANDLMVTLTKLLLGRPTYDQCVIALCKYYDVLSREPARRTVGTLQLITMLTDNIASQGEHYGPIYSYPLLGLMRLSYKWAEFRAQEWRRSAEATG